MRDVIEHYEGQSDGELAAELEAAFEDRSQTVTAIPNDLVPTVREFLSESPDPAPASPAA